MIWLNPFITSNFSACQDYFDEMAVSFSASIVQIIQTIPIDSSNSVVDEQRTISAEKREKALKDLYKHMKLLYPKMKDKVLHQNFHSNNSVHWKGLL